MPLGVGQGKNVEVRDLAIFWLCCRRGHPCFTNTCLVFFFCFFFLPLQHMSISDCVLTGFPLGSHLVLSTLYTFILGSCPRSHHVLHVLTAFSVLLCRLHCVLYCALGMFYIKSTELSIRYSMRFVAFLFLRLRPLAGLLSSRNLEYASLTGSCRCVHK